MKLLLTRHGETDFNLARRYQGQSDIPLNQTGVLQAQQIAQRLASEKIDFIYSSDLSRASDTAKHIAALQAKPAALQLDARWRELDFGAWEGLNYAEMNAGWQVATEKWYADPVNISTPNGESLLQLATRINSAFDALKEKYKDETILVVAHNGALQSLLCLILGVDLTRYWQFQFSQASLTIITIYEDKAILKLFNDVAHLQEK